MSFTLPLFLFGWWGGRLKLGNDGCLMGSVARRIQQRKKEKQEKREEK